ncbi:MAG TPA: PEP-CTERM sorting domain-containing protein [Bryobacteraceae bacterium]|nr:PEP-CTERM sorting domain-containing protein [Bryobacteraceae bacterium]
MTRAKHLTTVALLVVSTLPLQAGLIVNGGFEAGLSGWTRADQFGSEGAFLLQTGTVTPVTGIPVASPPEGSNAAMTDAEGPGSHVLYQDFVVPTAVANALLTFSLYINNGAPAFETPNTLDFATPTLNQQVRVDIVRATAEPFSVNPADILMSVYRTQVGDALQSGYTPISVDVTSLLQANANQTLRLRFAEVDNVFTFNAGVDAVDITTNAVPEPSTWLLVSSVLLGAALHRRDNARM